MWCCYVVTVWERTRLDLLQRNVTISCCLWEKHLQPAVHMDKHQFPSALHHTCVSSCLCLLFWTRHMICVGSCDLFTRCAFRSHEHQTSCGILIVLYFLARLVFRLWNTETVCFECMILKRMYHHTPGALSDWNLNRCSRNREILFFIQTFLPCQNLAPTLSTMRLSLWQ